jgi:hypothetical protein
MIKAYALTGSAPQRVDGSRILDGRDGALISGADLPIDGGVIAAIATAAHQSNLLDQLQCRDQPIESALDHFCHNGGPHGISQANRTPRRQGSPHRRGPDRPTCSLA